MSRRWLILISLTLARMTMGVAFQSIAALAPGLMARTGMGWAEIGALVGAFMLPGVAAALGGGWLGARIGEARAAIAGLAVMAVSGAALAFLGGFEALFAARLVLGAGGVALNVMLTKMAADWFEGEELPVAMGILSSSWPMGMALAMLALPPLETVVGTREALLAVALLSALACGLIAGAWRAPPRAAAASGGVRPDPAELFAVILAGLIWGLYNVPLILILGFGPELLTTRGLSPVEAGAAISVFGWVSILSVGLSGWIGARLGGRLPAVAVCALGWGAAIAWTLSGAAGGDGLLGLAVMALFAGIGAGNIVAMPSVATQPQSRALGMGVFFAVYYACMALGPPAVGAWRDASGDPASAFHASAAMLAAMLLLAVVFERGLSRRAAA